MTESELTVNFLSDYGLSDEFVGICHGVIHKIAPQSKVIDLTHQIPPGAINHAATLLRDSVPHLPKGVNLVVVDPGVGSQRLPIAVRSQSGDLFVGPNNGVLSPAVNRLGGPQEIVELNHQLKLSRPSKTFHGRDIFAPAAAKLALNPDLSTVGEPLTDSSFVELTLPETVVQPGELTAHCLRTDHFGNIQLNATLDDLKAAALTDSSVLQLIASGQPIELQYATTFSDVSPQQPLLYTDSTGQLAIAVRDGSASRQLKISSGDSMKLTKADV